MQVIALGTDLIENRRVRQVLDRHGERFYERVLTPAERDYVRRRRNPLPHVAGRFAAKEAVFKVLGTGWRGGIAWTDVEILNNPAGQPSVRLSGESQRVARQRRIETILVSISHTRHYASATAIGLSA